MHYKEVNVAKESFVIHHSLYEPIRSLSDVELGKLFRAIFEYEINGIEDVDNDIHMAFLFFKNTLDVNRKKYEQRCERNRENISKRWSQDE